MKKKVLLWTALAVAVLGVAAFSLFPRHSVKFDGDRVKTAERFSLRFDIMNTDDAETLSLREGDGLRAAWNIESGSVDILIGAAGAEPLYRADGRGKGDAANFELTVPSAGEYVISVSAREAKGWMEFETVRHE